MTKKTPEEAPSLSRITRELVQGVLAHNEFMTDHEIAEAIHDDFLSIVPQGALAYNLILDEVRKAKRDLARKPPPPDDLWAREWHENAVIATDGGAVRLWKAKVDRVNDRREQQITHMRESARRFEVEEKMREVLMPLLQSGQCQTWGEAYEHAKARNLI